MYNLAKTTLAVLGCTVAMGCTVVGPAGVFKKSTTETVDGVNDVWNDATISDLDPDQLPPEAQISGFYSAELDPRDIQELESEYLLGKVRIKVDFETGTITGGITDLGIYYQEIAGDCSATCVLMATIDGELGIAGSASDTSFLAIVSGSLSGDHVELGIFSAEAMNTISGSFVLLDGDYIGMLTELSYGGIEFDFEDYGTETVTILDGEIKGFESN